MRIMDDNPKFGPLIQRGDKPLLILLCLIFAVGFGSTYYAISLWQPQDAFEAVLKFIGRELNLTLLLFTALVALRCFISTPKLEKKLAATSLKVLIGMMLVACAVASLIILALFHTI